MDKKIFRRVGILIAVSLAALALVQAGWLVRMYNDMSDNFSRQVTAALEKAAYDELISRGSQPEMVQANMTRSTMSDSTSRITVDSIDFRTIRGTIRDISIPPLSSIHPSLVDYIRVSPRSEDEPDPHSTEVVMTLKDQHNGMPTQNIMVFRLPPRTSAPTEANFLRCDSLLGRNLFVAGIDRPYRLAVVDNQTRKELYATDRVIPRPQVYSLVADSQGKSSYVVSISDPNRGFLREMAGIIVTSLLIVVLIAFSFIYLLRTLFRQKTLERMRLDLTHNITHELKTPIAVASAAEEALTGFGAGDDPAKRRQYLGIISDQLENLSAMVENILSTSLYEQSEYRLEFSETGLRRIVLEQIDSLSLAESGKARVGVDIPEDMTVFCDREHFSTVIKNLLDNAVKYSPGTAEIEITARAKNGAAVISISDKGVGIPKYAQSKIFDKFYRVPSGDRHDVKGFGLGLYFVRDMVVKHGGTIRVESTEGKGTLFTIILPRHGK
ncbi:MAG: HAMP domain-containing histidine kinase [Rikenellaceae bacterium]|nr:HAMP domain-containing histidine kinase [Rikenellaceae bacterium]